MCALIHEPVGDSSDRLCRSPVVFEALNPHVRGSQCSFHLPMGYGSLLHGTHKSYALRSSVAARDIPSAQIIPHFLVREALLARQVNWNEKNVALSFCDLTCNPLSFASQIRERT